MPASIGLTLSAISEQILKIQRLGPVIAIDGHSSSGKSTLAKDLSQVLQLPHIDTGAMYRGVTWYCLQQDIDISDQQAVSTSLEQIQLRFEKTEDSSLLYCNDRDISSEIRLMSVSDHVSEVAAISAVRRAMVDQQRAMAQDQGIIMDGRDIGTVVFPDAQIKLFVTASLEVRTQRRYDELTARGVEIDASTVQANLQHRDHIDSTREDSPLKQAEDAILLDTSSLTRADMMQEAVMIIANRLKDA